MSFSRLNYDNCAYEKCLEESVNVGEYMLKQPKTTDTCFFNSPYIRLNKGQVATCQNNHLIDIDSELMGLKRTASKCVKSKMPECKLSKLKTCDENFLSPEDTRISNPPCTLRGHGWNRWEYLCENPQDSAIVPFTTNINDKYLAKDNHKPLIPKVYDSTNLLQNDLQCMTDGTILEGEKTPIIHWRSCDEIARM